MERGLLYQLGALSPERFEALRSEVQLAESLGLDAIWCLPLTDDHGGFRGGAPAIWLAGLAAETERIRLGWGLPGLWPPQEPPVREAEQAASLDGASGGRLDVGLLPELEGGAAEDAVLDEGVRMLVDMWAPATFSWGSARFRVPPIDVVPKPVQQPHPPIGLIGWTPAHAEAAGRAGLGFLDVSGGDEAIWQTHRACYVSGRATADPRELVCGESFGVVADLAAGSERARAAEGLGARALARDWLEELEGMGLDRVLLRAGPLEGGHAAACARIRWWGET